MIKYEVIHDSLAKQVFQKTPEQSLQLRKVRKTIENGYESAQQRRFSFSDEDFEFIHPLQGKIHLKPEVRDFYNVQYHQWIKEKRRAKRIRQALRLAGVIIGIILAILLIISLNATKRAVKGESDAMYQTHLSQAQFQFQDDDATAGYVRAKEAFEYAKKEKKPLDPVTRLMDRIFDQREQVIFRPLHTRIADHEGEPIEIIRFLNGGRSLISISRDGIIIKSNVFQDESDKNVRGDLNPNAPEFKINAHDQPIVEAGFIEFSQNLYTLSEDRSLRIWDQLGHQVDEIVFENDLIDLGVQSESGRELLITTEAGDLILIDLTKPMKQQRNNLIRASPGKGPVKFASFALKEPKLVVMYEKHVEVRDLNLRMVRHGELQWSTIKTAAISPNGDDIVIVYEMTSQKDNPRLWSATQDNSQRSLTIPTDRSQTPRLRSLSTKTESADSDEMVRQGPPPRTLLSPNVNLRATVNFSHHERQVNTVKYSRDGELILTASDDKTAGLWNKNGQLITLLRGHDEPVLDASFSADGGLIQTRSADFKTRIWSVRKAAETLSGYEVKQVAVLRQKHSDKPVQITAVDFSPSDNLGAHWIATATEDGMVHLWDASADHLAERVGFPPGPDEGYQMTADHLNKVVEQISNWGKVNRN